MVFRVKFERGYEADTLSLFKKSYKHHRPFLGDNQKAQQRKWYLIIQPVIIRKAGLLEVLSLGLCFSFDSCDFYFFTGTGLLAGEVSQNALDVLSVIFRYHFLFF
jgi:hypothetical protein